MTGIFLAGDRSPVRSIAHVLALTGLISPVVVEPAFAEEPLSVSQAGLRKRAEALELQAEKIAAQFRFLETTVSVPRQSTLTSAAERPAIAAIREQGSEPIRKSRLMVEPQREAADASGNQFFFQGFEVVDTTLIGLTDAANADRDRLPAAMGARLGVADRLKLELRVPYLYRGDRAGNTLLSTPGQPTPTVSGTAGGIGGIEAAAHYQLDDGLGGWPFLLGIVRVKGDTGKEVYNADLGANGAETELASGSGFWGVQPSFTVIFPSDPAVFFGNFGFTWNARRDADPGDSVNTSIGMGIGVNERTSFTFGFEFDYVFTRAEGGDDRELERDDLKVGSVQFGWSYQLTNDVGLNLNTGLGMTGRATDFRTTISIPIAFDLY